MHGGRSLNYEIIETIGFSEVRRRVDEHDPQDRGTKLWTIGILELVDSSRTGEWATIRLAGHELAEVLLGWHLSKEGPTMYAVVPPQGMLVKEVVSDFDGRIQQNAPMFASGIIKLAGEPLGRLFLSEVIPRNESGGTYKDVIERPGHLVCLDGLHRLIAHAKAGLLPGGQVEVTAALR